MRRIIAIRFICVIIYVVVGLMPHAVVAASLPAIPDDSVIEKSVRNFLGHLRGSYIYRNALVSKQVIEGMSGPPDDPIPLENRSYLVSGCRLHSCYEKAAIIVQPSGRVLAAAMINFHCGRRCDNEPTLTIMVLNGADRASLVQLLQQWSSSKNITKTAEILLRCTARKWVNMLSSNTTC